MPYVFGPNGERITSEDPYTLLNARPGAEDNIEKYRGQLHYLNGLLLEAVDEILEASDQPPIIILQGDHSSKVYSDPDPPPEVEALLLFPILNAYHLPGGGNAELYPSISPVNSFRLIWRTTFGIPLQTLPDLSYEMQDGPDGLRFVELCADATPCR